VGVTVRLKCKKIVDKHIHILKTVGAKQLMSVNEYSGENKCKDMYYTKKKKMSNIGTFTAKKSCLRLLWKFLKTSSVRNPWKASPTVCLCALKVT